MPQTRKKYRTNWPQPEDTTAGCGPLVTPGFLRHVGELLFGPQWLSPLALHLGAVRGKALSPATVHRWATETRSIPVWVAELLPEMLLMAQADLAVRAHRAGEIAQRMRLPQALPQAIEYA